MQEVGGPVERVDDPDEASSHELRTQLLADDAAAGFRGQQHLRDHLLGGAVDLGDEVAPRFGGPRAGSDGRSTPRM